MNASVSRTGTDTVTGAHSSRAVAAPSTRALSPKIRQNSDTGETPPSANPASFPSTVGRRGTLEQSKPLIVTVVPLLCLELQEEARGCGTHIGGRPVPMGMGNAVPGKWGPRPMGFGRADGQCRG
ncbi:hypothetical protein GCM10027075_22950 [Streptomyces heilongjiangensis]